jgi:ATP-dependent RNA helicase DeaD
MTEEMESFESFAEPIRKGVADLGWTRPMPVQRRVTPIMRAGRDLIVQAATGSGKTGAFGLPIMEKVDPKLRAIQALVLAPTRELAGQIAAEVATMGRHMSVETFPIYGGTAYGPQLEALDRGAHVIAGTPGRVLDHLKSGRMRLDRLKVLIFDEADELLSLGFWPDMKEIRSFIPNARQTGLFSATMPERVRSLARQFLIEPEFVSFTEGGVRSPEEIEHYHCIVPANEKDQWLLRILEHEDPASAIIFCNTRDDVRFVTAFLQRNQLDADMIQGDMNQSAREKVMRRIKAGELRFLVATDVAARGIDISDLSHVISYSAPDSPETYMHRTGRTGRAGKTGTAISLVSGLDIGNFKSLQAINRMVVPEKKLPTQEQVHERMAQRLEVKAEQSLRDVPDRERRLRQDTYLPIVKKLASTESGLQTLSTLLFQQLRGKPEPVAVVESSPSEPTPAADVMNTEENGSSGARKRSRGGRRRRGRRGSAGD